MNQFRSETSNSDSRFVLEKEELTNLVIDAYYEGRRDSFRTFGFNLPEWNNSFTKHKLEEILNKKKVITKQNVNNNNNNIK